MNKYREIMQKFNISSFRDIPNPEENILEEIKKFEKDIGSNLPLDYVNFLSNYDCIYFVDYVNFPFLETYPNDERALIDIFFGFLIGDTYDLWENYHDSRERMPSNFIPIATDPGGNKLCIVVSGDYNGKIYFWDHEQEELNDSSSLSNNLYLVANSFDDFIKSLEIYTDNDD